MAVVSEAVRAQVLTQAGGVCEYCRYPEEFHSRRFAVDHIFPRVKGGTDDLTNLALSCRNCNERKQDATEANDLGDGENRAAVPPARAATVGKTISRRAATFA